MDESHPPRPNDTSQPLSVTIKVTADILDTLKMCVRYSLDDNPPGYPLHDTISEAKAALEQADTDA